MSNRISGTFSADGSSAISIIEGDTYFVHAVGDFGGGLINVQILMGDGTTWTNYEGAVFNGPFTESFAMPRLTKARITLSESTSPDVDYEIMSSGEGC